MITQDIESLCLPVVRGRKGHYRELFETFIKRGYLYARVDGEMMELTAGIRLDRYKSHDIELVVDRVIVVEEDRARILKSLGEAMRQGDGTLSLYDYDADTARFYSRHLMCPTASCI